MAKQRITDCLIARCFVTNPFIAKRYGFNRCSSFELNLLDVLFSATSRADAPISQVIKKAVNGNRGPIGDPAILGVAANHVLGPQTRNAKSASSPVSI